MTLEISLNLAWLSIAAASAIGFARYSAGQSRTRRCAGCLVTICVLALLFPIISVTDDLHSVPALLEERTSVHAHSDPAAALLPADRFCALQPVVAFALRPDIAPSARLLDGVKTSAGVRPPPPHAERISTT